MSGSHKVIIKKKHWFVSMGEKKQKKKKKKNLGFKLKEKKKCISI